MGEAASEGGAPGGAGDRGGVRQVILAVEDNPSTREFVRFTLEDEGFEVLGAQDAASALSILAERSVDLVLLDLVLPDMPGLDLAARIRRIGGRAVVVVAFTGAAPEDYQDDPNYRDIDDVLLKPVDPEVLVQVIEDHLTRVEAPTSPAEGRGLVQIGSDPGRHEALTTRLQKLGFDVDIHFDPESGIAAAVASTPAAVVVDVLAPGINGFEVCQTVRTSEGLEDTHVLLVTSFVLDEDDLAAARRYGATAFVTITPDLKDLELALLAALATSPPKPEGASAERDQVEWLRRQLEKGEAAGARLAQQARVRAGQAQVLERLAEVVSGTQSLDRIFLEALSQTLHTLAASRGAIYKWADDDLVMLASIGDGWDPNIAAVSRTGIVKDALAGRGTVVDGSDVVPDVFGSLSADRWVAVAPIFSGAEPLGLMVIGSRREELRPSASFLEALGLQLGLAVRIHQASVRIETSERLIRRDEVTGLASAVVLEERLESLIAELTRSAGTGALLLIGVDRFWQVRSSLGAEGAHEMLRGLGHRISNLLDPSLTLARVGERFAVLVPSVVKDGSDAVTLARRLLAVVSEPFQIGGRDFYLTAGVGISLLPDEFADPARAMGQAEAALHRARERGGNTFEMFGPDWGQEAVDRATLGNDLPASMGSGLLVHYQPIFRLPERSVRGAEALLRWEHPSRGMLQPGDFIPIAEENGLIIQVGEWVLRAASEQARVWNGNGHKAAKVSFNVGARQLYEGDLPATVSRVVEETGVDPALLELEVTESVAMRDLRHSAKVLLDLRTMGLTISLDDFGTGHSSLAYLRDLPVDIVKIDRSFISGRTDDSTAAIVAATISLAHGLGMTCVGEGVETPEQLDLLVKSGCDQAQGFFLGRPGPPDEVGAVLGRSTA